MLLEPPSSAPSSRRSGALAVKHLDDGLTLTGTGMLGCHHHGKMILFSSAAGRAMPRRCRARSARLARAASGRAAGRAAGPRALGRTVSRGRSLRCGPRAGERRPGKWGDCGWVGKDAAPARPAGPVPARRREPPIGSTDPPGEGHSGPGPGPDADAGSGMMVCPGPAVGPGPGPGSGPPDLIDGGP